MRVAAVKAWIGGAGVVVGLLGVALAIDWIVWIGVGCLGAAFLLRFMKPTSGGVDA